MPDLARQSLDLWLGESKTSLLLNDDDDDDNNNIIITIIILLLFTAMDDPPRPPVDSARSLEMSGYMPCRGDFDVVRF